MAPPGTTSSPSRKRCGSFASQVSLVLRKFASPEGNRSPGATSFNSSDICLA
jgi:hypothetical protein